MTDTIDRIGTLEAHLLTEGWSFERENGEAIAAEWVNQVRAKPKTFNGTILMMRVPKPHDRRFTFVSCSYAALLYWREQGCPEAGIILAFPTIALRTRDNAFLLGRMAEHTVNAGKVYFPGGNLDPDDAEPDGSIDLERAALREVIEETGLGTSDFTLSDHWLKVQSQARCAFIREGYIDLHAASAREMILTRISKHEDAELDDIIIVRTPDDINMAIMPPFTVNYLNWAFSKSIN